jgi:RNA polymerase sigma-70 factor (ECF subfamily)
MIALKRQDRKGALVRGVVPGNGADKAGISENDVILAFNGAPITDAEELRWLASIAGVGTTATVRVARGERVFDVHVVLTALQEAAPAPMAPPGFPLGRWYARRGHLTNARFHAAVRFPDMPPGPPRPNRPLTESDDERPSGVEAAARPVSGASVRIDVSGPVNSPARRASNKEARKSEAEEDRALIEAAKNGDKQAFRALVERHQRRAFTVAVGLVRDENEAREIVQEAFLRVYKGLATFQHGSSFFTWLYRIVTNLSIDLMRKPGRQADELAESNEVAAEGDDGAFPFLSKLDGHDPLESIHRQELAGRIGKALDALPPYHRGVILMREVEGMSYDEMADAMKVSKGTIMSRLFHARQKLQRALGDLYRETQGREPPGSSEEEP